MPQWISTLISVAVGVLLGFLSSIGLESWRSRQNDKKVRASVLGEIRANVESAKNGEYSSLLWVDDVYKANLDKLGCFTSTRLQTIVRFYAKVAQYRDRITRGYQEHIQREERNRQLGIQGNVGVFEGTVELLAREIEKLGDEILNAE